MNATQDCRAAIPAAVSESDSAARYLLFGQVAEAVKAALGAGREPNVEAWISEHPHLAAEIRELVEALRLMHVAGPVDGEQSEASPAALRTRAPRERLGEFHLLREIGRGGMGVVYEAEQASLARRVAVKVLPLASMLDPARLRRFRNEALAAAQLEHPNIVDVHGVGCEDGVHFYVMRYIEGATLSELIDALRSADPARDGAAGGSSPAEHGSPPACAGTSPGNPAAASPRPAAETEHAALSGTHMMRAGDRFRLAARIGVQIAEALEHAHQQGVVHRDIKPSNLILDAHGHVSICDFGLAHIGTDATLTATGDLLGTLRYMSPEQALGRRRLIDHRTDIYSLGVTLYELITLHPAHPGEHREEILRFLATEEPLRPRRLERQVPADLETIVLKAIAREPADRYASAGEMADDLLRFLENRPIAARRPSLADRSGKWLRRHRGVSLSAIALLVLTLGALVLHTLSLAAEKRNTLDALDVARQRERDAEAARTDAERAANEAQAIVRFVTRDLLAPAEPARSSGRELTVRDLLDNAERRLDGEFRDQPSVEAGLRHTLGVLRYKLGDLRRAEQHLHRAAELREVHLGPEHLETLSTLEALHAVYGQQNRPEASARLAERVYLTRRRLLGDEHPKTLNAAGNWAIRLWARGDFKEALQLDRQVLEARRRVHGEHHVATLRSRYNIAYAYERQGDWKGAAEQFRRVLEIQKDSLGHDHPETLKTRAALARVLRQLGALEEALRETQEALTGQRRVLGDEHPHTLGSLQELAFLLSRRGRRQEALGMHERLLEIQKRVFGREHPATLGSQKHIGNLLYELRRYDEARSALEAFLATAERALGPEHQVTLAGILGLGAVFRAQGDSERALELHRRARDGFRKALGPEHPHTLAARNNVGNCLCDLERFDEARAELQGAISAARGVLGPDHRDTLMMTYNLAAVCERSGDLQEACRLGDLQEACRLYEDVFHRRLRQLGCQHSDTRVTLRALLRALQAAGETERARDILTRFEQLRRAAAAEPVEAPRPATG